MIFVNSVNKNTIVLLIAKSIGVLLLYLTENLFRKRFFLFYMLTFDERCDTIVLKELFVMTDILLWL